MPTSDLVVVSNRGPVSFTHGPAGELVSHRGGGGLVSLMAPALGDTDALWVSAAMTDGDRAAAAGARVEAEGFRLWPVSVDPEEYRQFYDVIANATLWFTHHGLHDLPRRPRFDRRWHEAWEAYVAVNARFADAVAEVAADGATVLVQDYHLTLLGTRLAKERPDVRSVHFHHTPFADPRELRVLPDAVAEQVLTGLAGHGACGFHSRRWAAAFEACCREVLGQSPPTFVSAAASDAASLRAIASAPAAADARARLDEMAGDRLLLVRVDRIELSKNLLRGFLAFEEALASSPGLRGRVVFGAFCYPSREGLIDYLAYRQEVEGLVARINETWGDADWTPIVLDETDDYPRSVAALARADAILVNPVRDGLNLVAQEAVLVNDRLAPLVLSHETGVWDQLGDGAIGINPFDVSATAEAIVAALEMPAHERQVRADKLRAIAGRRRPADWLADLVAAAGAPG
ncbi:MAG TPA: trehalose-6-phosphate synthase [Acidimicrobiales bacterium]